MGTRQELHELVNLLPEEEVSAAQRYLEFLLSLDEAPVAPDMLARIDEARRHPPDGIPHDEVMREFGL